MMQEIDLRQNEIIVMLTIALTVILIIVMLIILFYLIAKMANKEKPPSFSAEDFKLFHADTCKNFADYLDTEAHSDSDVGKLSLECAAIILRGLAENMYTNETLSEYFQRKNDKE